MSFDAVVPFPLIDSPAQGLRALLAELEDWLVDALPRHNATPWGGGHDEGTFLTSWAGYHELTGDARVLDLAVSLRDAFLDWAAGHLVHGYWPRQEVHHGPEHFVIFLAWLARIHPGDRATADAILDAAEHAGNWVPDVPPWYDWDADRFRSTHLGTEHVGDDGLNVTAHLRLARLSLDAWRLSADDRYRDLASRYAGCWADALLAAPEAPLTLDEGRGDAPLPPPPEPLTAAESRRPDAYEAARKRFLGAAPRRRGPVERIESYIADGAPDLFLELHEVTRDARFAEAFRRLVTPLVAELADPCAHPAGRLVALWRRTFSDHSRDEAIVETVGPCPDPAVLSGMSLAVRAHVDWEEQGGVGKRRDMPGWFVVGAEGHEELCRIPSPAALALCHEITGETPWAVVAFQLALARLQLARRVFPDGREHGCGSRSVAAACRGHGRNWGDGDVSTLLADPALRAL
jgi:hypothetical protein